MTNSTPSPNRSNGRDRNGRFAKGNSGGPGNPLAKHTGRLRSALINAVTEQDMHEVVQQLISVAKKGDTAAAKLLFDRCLGRPTEADLLDRIMQLEDLLGSHPKATASLPGS